MFRCSLKPLRGAYPRAVKTRVFERCQQGLFLLHQFGKGSYRTLFETIHTILYSNLSL